MSTVPSQDSPTTEDRQRSLTPDAVLAELVAGNEDYIAGRARTLDLVAAREASASGQYPKAAILSCLDSRIVPELVFGQGIGDLFVARVAGNVETPEILGSFEFATKVAGSKLVLVLGHTGCGAVGAACNHVDMGNLPSIVDRISQVLDEEKGNEPDAVAARNVLRTVDALRSGSAILADLEASGDIRIVGGMYDLKTGKVTLMEGKNPQSD